MNRARLLKPYFAMVLIAGTAALIYSAASVKWQELDWRFAVLVLAMAAIASRLSISIPHVKGEITVGDTLIFLTLLTYGGEAAVLIGFVDGLSSSIYVTRKPRVWLFNSAQMAVSTLLNVVILRLCFGSLTFGGEGYSTRALAEVCAMALIQYVSNSGLVAIYTALKTNNPVFATWRKSYLWTSLSYFAGASVASLAVHFLKGVSLYAILAVTPIIAIIYLTYQTYLKNIQASAEKAEQARRYAEVLEQSEERFRMAFDYASIGMALVAEDGRWLQVNKALCEIVGYSEFELLATDIQALAHTEDLGDLLVQQSRVMKGQVAGYQTEKRFIHKAGHEVWTCINVSRIHDPETKSLRLIFQIQDITARKRAETQLVHDAFHDGLTGLPNRALFVDHLKLAVGRNHRKQRSLFAVLFLDVDRFKIVNDSLGHLVGDELLMAMARRIQSCLRPGDTIARFGGDEFTILLEDLKTAAEATHVAERIQHEVALPFELQGREVFTSLSIGIASSTIGYDEPEDVLRDADTAMYCAKSLGGNRYQIFDKTMHARAVEMLQMQNDLRQALVRDELLVEYQPIVSLKSFRVTGFEALARWRHSERGLINPNDFIPIAEETGLIVTLGNWVLRQACTQARMWQELYAADEPLTMSVNLSAKQFNQPDLIEQIEQVLKETGLDPSALKLEITESVVAENVEVASEMLNRLRRLGVGLAIDDFGTGYSSLSSLYTFPISTLKIDSSFIQRMHSGDENTEIVRTIVSLAGNLAMDLTAEGVETLEQATMLRTLGCQTGQGYFFSLPLCPEDAEALLQESAPVAIWPQLSGGNVESILERLIA